MHKFLLFLIFFSSTLFCSEGFYVQVTPLIWQAHLNGANVAIATSGSESFFNSGKSRVKNIAFNWDFGFRVGVGFDTCHDAWDILVQWTHWSSDGKRNLTAPSDGALYPTRGSPALIQGQVAQSVSSKWTMDFNLLDLENGKCFYVSPCISLHPFAGLRTLWINQKFNTLYHFPESFAVNQKDKFWGIGIRGGMELRWQLVREVSFFSNIGGNLLYAYHNVNNKEPSVNIQNFFHTGTAIFDMQMGLGWDHCFCCDQYRMGIDLGWELHWYPGQNQFFNFVDDVMVAKFILNQGDLGIMGYFVKAELNF